MFDAEKTHKGRLIKKVQSSIYSEKKAFANWHASDKIGNKEILGRLSGSFTAPKLNLVTLLLRGFVLPL